MLEPNPELVFIKNVFLESASHAAIAWLEWESTFVLSVVLELDPTWIKNIIVPFDLDRAVLSNWIGRGQVETESNIEDLFLVDFVVVNSAVIEAGMLRDDQ